MSDYETPTTAEVECGYAYDDDRAGDDPEKVAAFRRWLAAHDAGVAAKALAPIRAALANHPRCDLYDDDDPITCGWQLAVQSVQAALDAVDKERS